VTDSLAEDLNHAITSTIAIREVRAHARDRETERQAAVQAARRADREADQQRMTALRQERAQAIWRLYHDHGMSTPEIERVLVDGLKRQGLDEAAISELGVRHDTVSRIAGSRKNPKPMPSA
jgi:hypothetical protein